MRWIEAVGILGGLTVCAATLEVRMVRAQIWRARTRRRFARVRRSPAGGPISPAEWLPDSVRAIGEGFGLSIEAETMVLTGAGGAATVLVAALVFGGVGTAAVVAFAIAGSLVAGAYFARGRSLRLVDRLLPGTLDAVASGLRSGSSLTQALDEGRVRSTGALRADLDRVQASLAAGLNLPEALGAWRDRRRSASVRATVGALSIAHEVGGGAARAIDGVAASLRDRAAIESEVAALSVQAKASAVVIVAAPLAFAAFTGASDGESWRFMTSTAVGLSCLAAGLALDLAGGAWMIWLARSVT